MDSSSVQNKQDPYALMDDAMAAFFNFSKPFERKTVITRPIENLSPDVSSGESDPDTIEPEGYGQGYAEEYKIADETNFAATYIPQPKRHGFSELDDLTSYGPGTRRDMHLQEGMTDVYKNYDFSKRSQKTLPIHSMENEILTSINSQDVLIIQGDTGCGKTTQVPQFILDNAKKNNLHCNIIVTQPRRIAAISIANRVCMERGWALGGLVGYQIGLHTKSSEDTRLLYVTTGVLLQKLIAQQNLAAFTHIILDEVHERSAEMDFLLMVVKKFQRLNSQFVKVILMSATFNTDKFSSYFSSPTEDGIESAEVLSVTSKNEFNVRVNYLENLGNISVKPTVSRSKPGIEPEMYDIAYRMLKLLSKREPIPVKSGSDSNDETEVIGSFLIFLPGIMEIETMYNLIEKNQSVDPDLVWYLVPLHSSLTSDEQQRAFRAPPVGARKVILSTNIAESSITVADVKYVIDFCLTKVILADSNSTYSGLSLEWASHTNCVQRAGRVGRVSDGKVFRLVPKQFYDECMEKDSVPEMLRAPLSRLVLLSKKLNIGHPKATLALAMDPPNLENIQATILLLKETGGLLRNCNHRLEMLDGDLTLLGNVMASLPVSVHVAKLIVLGHIFSCLEECIIMGAAMTQKSLFSSPFQDKLSAYTSKLTWADGSMSDPIALMIAYKVWVHGRQKRLFRNKSKAEREWAQRYYIQITAMNEVADLVSELKERLRSMNIVEPQGAGRLNWTDEEKSLVLKTVIAGAFYPNYFTRGKNIDERDALKLLDGRDPFSTVYFTGLQHPGQLYAKTIKKKLQHIDDTVRVEFDSSSKVYILLNPNKSIAVRGGNNVNGMNLNSAIPGKVPLSMYKAIKMRNIMLQEGANFMELKVLSERDSYQFAERLGLGTYMMSTWQSEAPRMPTLKSCLPGIQLKYVSFVVCHYVDAGHFWVHPRYTSHFLIPLTHSINKMYVNTLAPFSKSKPPLIGQIVAAPYEDKYYRVRVEDIGKDSKGVAVAKVFFVDYGNTDTMAVSFLREFAGEALQHIMTFPMLAFEAKLCSVEPSQIMQVGAQWSKKANAEVHKRIDRKEFAGIVYSVVHGVVSMTVLLDKLGKEKGVVEKSQTLNEWLVDEMYGQVCEESYASKLNYDLRLQNDRFTEEQRVAFNLLQEDPQGVVQEVEPPLAIDCKFRMKLKGPFSPLEQKVYSLHQLSESKMVSIESSSVNSVLLDTNPQDSFERLIIASDITQTNQSDRMSMRQTTVMPSIPGLPVIMSLIFCPSAKLYPNENCTRYAQVLCGLGADEKGRALYPEHDMVLNFDVKFSAEDLKNINRLRFILDRTIATTNTDEEPVFNSDNINMNAQKIKKILLDLLQTKRRLVEVSTIPRPDKWAMTDEYKERLCRAVQFSDAESAQGDSIYSLHDAINIQDENFEFKLKLAKNQQDLLAICNSTMPITDVMCELCEIRLTTLQQLRIHMHSRVHKDREAQLPPIPPPFVRH